MGAVRQLLSATDGLKVVTPGAVITLPLASTPAKTEFVITITGTI